MKHHRPIVFCKCLFRCRFWLNCFLSGMQGTRPSHWQIQHGRSADAPFWVAWTYFLAQRATSSACNVPVALAGGFPFAAISRRFLSSSRDLPQIKPQRFPPPSWHPAFYAILSHLI
jgi:hypothetical protein